MKNVDTKFLFFEEINVFSSSGKNTLFHSWI